MKNRLRKMKEIGREDVNKYGAYIKFYCTPTRAPFDNVARLCYGRFISPQ